MKRAARRVDPPRATRVPARRATLDPIPFPELVFALVGPAGADLPGNVPAALTNELQAFGYTVEPIRLSKLIEAALGKNYDGRSEDQRMSGLMTDGTRVRERTS